MIKLRSPLLGAALAGILASTTGYCVLTNSPDGQPPDPPPIASPLRLLPQAIIPYPLEDLPEADADD